MIADGARTRPGTRMRVPGVAVMASVLLLAIIVHAAVAGQQPVTVTPTAMAAPLPVTMTAVPLTGTTVTGGVVSSTTGFLPILTASSTLTLARAGSQDWDVTLQVTGATGITGAESFILGVTGLGVGDVPKTVTLLAATTYPVSTAAAGLDGSEAAITGATTSLIAGCLSCSITIEVRMVPTGGSLPLLVYPYTFTTAA